MAASQSAGRDGGVGVAGASPAGREVEVEGAGAAGGGADQLQGRREGEGEDAPAAGGSEESLTRFCGGSSGLCDARSSSSRSMVASRLARWARTACGRGAARRGAGRCARSSSARADALVVKRAREVEQSLVPGEVRISSSSPAPTTRDDPSLASTARSTRSRCLSLLDEAGEHSCTTSYSGPLIRPPRSRRAPPAAARAPTASRSSCAVGVPWPPRRPTRPPRHPVRRRHERDPRSAPPYAPAPRPPHVPPPPRPLLALVPPPRTPPQPLLPPQPSIPQRHRPRATRASAGPPRGRTGTRPRQRASARWRRAAGDELGRRAGGERRYRSRCR